MSISAAPTRRVPLGAVARFFLMLGTVAFGGPAAHIAMMEDQAVRRRAWLTREEFLDLLGAANLLPGPSSTELAIFIGYRVAGGAGLAIAGACFILPASLIVLALAWIYVRSGALPAVSGVLRGVQPVVIAVLFQATWSLARTALKSRTLVLAALACALLAALGVPPLAVLAAGALLAALERARGMHAAAVAPLPMLALAPAAGVGLWPLALVFLKVGALLFGSGYVLLAFLRADLVQRLGWLTERQLLDAIAVGQVTPGPVFTTATFVGYVLAGFSGAAVATVAIFLPSFVFVALGGPLLARARRSPLAGAMLDGVTVASLALIAVVTIQLARSAITGIAPALLASVSAYLLLRWRVNSAWLMLAGALLGLLLARA